MAGRHFNSKGVDYNIRALPHHLAILLADEVYVAQSPETDDGDRRRWTGFTHLPDNG